MSSDTGTSIPESALVRFQHDNTRLREQVAGFQQELERLAARQRDLEQHLTDSARLVAELDAKLAERDRTIRACLERCAIAEQQSSRLMRLYVALHRLHEARNRERVLDAIQEIVNHIIGSEELGIFRLDERSRVLSLVASMGIEPSFFGAIPLGQGPIGQAALAGQTYVAPAPLRTGQWAAGGVSACVPLRLEGRVHGALAIFGLLPQKQGLDEVDQELLALLEGHAAPAMVLADVLNAPAQMAGGES